VARPTDTKEKPGEGAAAPEVKTESGTASATATTTKSDVTPPSKIEPEQTDNPASEMVGSKEPENPVPQDAKSEKIDRSIPGTVEEAKLKRNGTAAEPGAALIIGSDMGTPSEVNLENTDNPAVDKFKPKKTGKPVSEVPLVVSTAASEQGSEASKLSGPAENGLPKADEGGKQDTDHLAEVFLEREQPDSGDTKPTGMPQAPMGTLQRCMSWASGVGTEFEYETTQVDESTEEEPTVQGSRRSSISIDGRSDMEISVHEASNSRQLKWEIAENEDTECGKTKEGAEEEKITKPLGGKSPDNGCDEVRGQWQSGPVYPPTVAVNPSRKGSPADDDIAPRADGADGFLNISNGWITAPPTVMVPVGERAEERTKYLGELFVSDE
jgi:hypothetical protein